MMTLHFNRHIRQRFAILMLSLMAAVFIAAGRGGCPVFAESGPAMNASGTPNTPPAADPLEKNEGFSVVLYDNRNGLPTSEANAIAQTGDGFIWIGSYAGLVRYDGNTFERLNSSTGIANVRSLYVDSRDRLWIGTNDTGVFVMERGEFTGWAKEDGLRSTSIRTLAEAEDGTIYVGSATGAAAIDKNLRLTVIEDERISEQTISELRRGPGNTVYGVTARGDFFSLEDSAVKTFMSAEKCGVNGITCFLPDPERPGYLYFGTNGSNLYYGTPEDSTDSMEIFNISPLSYPESFELIGGKLWVTAKDGIGALDEDGFHFLRNIPVGDSVGHVMTDYEGNLWFTSRRQGVLKIVSNQFSDIFARYRLRESVVNTTCLYGQQLFIGTDSGLIVLNLETGRQMYNLPLTEAVTASGKDLILGDLLKLLKGVRIRSILCDSRDRLWIATYSKYGLLRYDQGKVLSFGMRDGFFSDNVRTTLECEDGTILAANIGGVSIIRDDQVTGGYDEESGLGNTQILTMVEGFNHELIFGSDGSGISIITGDGEAKHIGTDEGLESEIILRIVPGKNGAVYWIVTSNSLAYMTPDYQVTTIRHFPYSNNYDIFENSKGDLWVLSSNGIYVVPAEDLLLDEAVEPVHFDISSGLPYIATANAFNELTPDNDLYISSVSGVVKVNIEEPFQNLNELKIALPFVDADGERLYPDQDGSFTIGSSVRRLTIYPYVFSSSLNNPQVSYRLEGFDSADASVSRSELLPVNYTNLPEGSYSFTLSVKDPVSHITRTESFRIIKEKRISARAAGGIILNAAALFFVAGILLHGSLLRKTRRYSRRLFSNLVITVITQAVFETLSHVIEGRPSLYVREVMTAANMIFYAAIVFFAFWMMLYLDYEAWHDRDRLTKYKRLWMIPLCAFLVILVVNIKTGWIFSIGEGNIFVPGPYVNLVLVPVVFYYLMALNRAFRVNTDLVLIGLLLMAVRVITDIFLVRIVSPAFINSLVLLCVHIYAGNRTTMEAL